MEIEACPLCLAVSDHPLSLRGINANTILGRNEEFIIVPALGPLVIGHVLAISAAHTDGLKYLQASVQRSYEELSVKIHRYCRDLGDTVLEAEHGARSTSLRGPCIRHTHVHILPRLGTATTLFENKHNLSTVDGERLNATDSYLWVSNGRHIRTYDASRIVGQQIRQTIGNYLKVDDWDWAVNPKAELITSTIAYWSNVKRWLH